MDQERRISEGIGSTRVCGARLSAALDFTAPESRPAPREASEDWQRLSFSQEELAGNIFSHGMFQPLLINILNIVITGFLFDMTRFSNFKCNTLS